MRFHLSKRTVFAICILEALFLSSSSATSATNKSIENDETTHSVNERILEQSTKKHFIVGIVTQPIPKSEDPYAPVGFIDSTYVERLTGFNISVVAIPHHLPHSSIQVLLHNIDGVLLPGGTTSLLQSNSSDSQNGGSTRSFTRFGRFVKGLVQQAVSINRINGTFPIYGICLGNEGLQLSFTDDVDILQHFTRWEKKDQLAPIKFVTQPEYSDLMSGISSSLRSKMENSDSQIFHHHWSISYPAALQNSEYMSEFRIVATARDIYDLEYVAMVESKNYPFVGTEFHTNRIQGNETADTQREIQYHFFDRFYNQVKQRERSHKNDKKVIELFGLKSEQKTKISTYHESDVYVVDFGTKK